MEPLETLTLKSVCNLLNLEVPENLKTFSGYTFSRATSSWSLPNDDSIHFCPKGTTVSQVDKLISVGIPLLVAEEQMFDSRGAAVPTLVHPDPTEAYTLLMRTMKRQHEATTIAVTGSNGKTTCRELIRLVASTKFNTHYSRGNSNVFGRVGNTIQRMPSDTEVYVQETGAAAPGIIERAAQMLEPDAALITNIGFAHIGEYGGEQENLVEDKLSLDRYLRDDGVFFINFDDPILRSKKLSHRVVSYGLESSGVDYTAEDIGEEDGGFNFTVVDNISGVRTPARIHAVGSHNVSNAIAAFAVGRWLGLDPSDIVAGIAQYRAQGTRQNLTIVNGQQVLVDCFNATEIAMVKMADALQSLSVSEDGRRVLVLGDIPRLGDHAESIHRDVGRKIAEFEGIDSVYCFGPHSRALKDELDAHGKRAFHSENRDEFNTRLLSDIKNNDVLAFKGGAPVALALTVDTVFGTDFIYSDPHHMKTREYHQDGNRYRIIKEYGAELVQLLNIPPDGTLDVGGTVSSAPLVLVGRRSCAKTQIQNAVIKPPVRTIGERAFARCTDLVSVNLPSTLRVIRRGAFLGCAALTEIRIPEGVTTIQANAFRNCINLTRVTIPRSVRTIEHGAFSGCRRAVIQVYEESPMAEIMQDRLSARQFQLI